MHISLNSKRQYIGYIDFCDKDDNNKDNVGLYMIEVCTCSREELPEEFAWEGVNNGNPAYSFTTSINIVTEMKLRNT